MNAVEYRTEEQNQMRITGLRILARIIPRELLVQPCTGAALGVRRFDDPFVIKKRGSDEYRHVLPVGRSCARSVVTRESRHLRWLPSLPIALQPAPAR